MKKNNRVALVTGGNRGIGFEVCRQLAERGITVLMGTRDLQQGRKVATSLQKLGLSVSVMKLDITNENQILSAVKFVAKNYGQLDILINNAGAFLDSVRVDPEYGRGSAFFAKLSAIRESFEINSIGAFRMCQAFLPLMIKNQYGRIVNVSSGMGQLTHMNGTRPGYRMSKAALNAVTRIFADECRGRGVLVNSVCPGFVRTRMGGKDADLSPAVGAKTVVWLALLPSSGPTGKFFRERKMIAW